MILHLLRHAKTQQSSPTGRDFDRFLKEKGILQADQMAKYLSTSTISTIWCSDAQRTTETLKRIQKNGTLSNARVTFDHRLYLANRDMLLHLLWNESNHSELMIVGHNFGISDLATYLTDERIELKTSELISIEFPGFAPNELSRGLGVIRDRYHPTVDL